MKKESTEQLVLALRMALHGEYYVSSKVIGAIFNKALGIRGTGKIAAQSPVSLLSDRELEIFEMIGRGLNTRDISAALRISPKTVESHRLHTKEKLQLQSAAELIQHATRWVEYESSSEERSAK
jgi:DNA-binding NarL/FixJ family response regulator